MQRTVPIPPSVDVACCNLFPDAGYVGRVAGEAGASSCRRLRRRLSNIPQRSAGVAVGRKNALGGEDAGLVG